MITGDDHAAFYAPGGNPDNTGKMARLYGESAGDDQPLEIWVKAADYPFMTYHPAVEPLKTFAYRCNFLSNAGITPAQIPVILGDPYHPNAGDRHTGIANVILRQVGVELVPDTSTTLGDIPTGVTTAALAAHAVTLNVLDAQQLFINDANLLISGGGNSETIHVTTVVGNTVTFTGGNAPGLQHAYAAGATVTWDLTEGAAGGIRGCRAIGGNLDAAFINVPDTQRVPFSAMLNCRNGFANFNFVNTGPFGSPDALQQFAIENSLANNSAPSVLTNQLMENGVTCPNFNIYQAPWGQLPLGTDHYGNYGISKNYVGAIVYSTGAYAGAAGNTWTAALLVHEMLHGCALPHRQQSPDNVTDGISGYEDQALPFDAGGPNVAHPDAGGQNIMFPTLNLDIDGVQARVVRATGL